MYSYEVASEEVDVGVPSVVKGRVDRTAHPWETFRDEPRIGPTFPIHPENLVALAVVPPELSACTEKNREQHSLSKHPQRNKPCDCKLLYKL